MDVPPPVPASPAGPTPFERVLLVLLAVAAGVVSLWLTGLIGFIVGLTFDCNGPHDAIAVIEITMFCAVATAIATLPWLLTVSLLRVGIGRRWPGRRWWLVVPLGLAVVSAPVWTVAAIKTPPPSATCQPFSLD